MTQALVTGSSGFIGANLVRRLLADGHEVHALLRPEADTWRVADVLPHIRREPGEVADAAAVARAIATARAEWVFHLAAYGAYPHQRDPELATRTNLLGTIRVVDAARAAGCGAVVCAGSSSEYGPKDHAPGEDEAVAPNSVYAVTKAAATSYGRWIGSRDAARVVTLRLYSAYGPWEDPARFIPQLILAGLERRLPPLVNPRVARDFVHVDDIVEAFITAARSGGAGAVYNVGTGTQTTIGEAVGMARALLPIAGEPRWGSMPDRAWDTTVWVADPGRIARELGWHASIPFTNGLARTIEWLRADPRWIPLYRERDRRPKPS